MSTTYVVTLDRCVTFVTLAGAFSTEGLARSWISDMQAVKRRHGCKVRGYLIFKMRVNEPGIPKWFVRIRPDGTEATPSPVKRRRIPSRRR